MTAVDPYTKASQTYINAMRTCQKTGDAFEVTGGDNNYAGWLVVGCAVVIVIIACGVVGL